MIEGKGFYMWILERCEGGDMAKCAAVAKEAGLTHVIAKVANGTYRYNDRYIPRLITEMNEVGIKVCGYQYIYGGDPIGEANRAVYEIKEYELTEFIIDAEGEWKQTGDDVRAKAYMGKLSLDMPPTVDVYLSSYRYPSYHQDFCWSAFRESNIMSCDMPQVYWLGSSNPAFQLDKSYHEYQRMVPKLPYLPTGAAFTEGEWASTANQVTTFLDEAKAMGLPGANFWEWYNCRRYLPLVWDAIAKYQWTPPTPPPPTPNHDHADIYTVLKNHDDRLVALEKARHDHPDLFMAIRDLTTRLNEHLSAPPPAPVTVFQVTSSVANARRISGYNQATPPRPIMAIYEGPTGRVQYITGETVPVEPATIVADGGGRYAKILNSPVAGVDLYLRMVDGVLVS